jgi:tetratricopeptide (TPR) repeat protein
MGLYKQGRSLIEQAKTINEALGARRVVAYNLNNLGYIYIAGGDLRKARQLNEQALKEVSPSQDAVGKIGILNDLGLVLLAMGDVNGAIRRFTEGRELAISHGREANSCEIAAGLAACAIMQGQLDEARKFVHEAWDHLKEHGWLGIGNPGVVYRSCAETFDALSEVENARAVIESGYQELMEVAGKINMPEWRQSFLENVPENRAIMEMWERRKQ